MGQVEQKEETKEKSKVVLKDIFSLATRNKLKAIEVLASVFNSWH